MRHLVLSALLCPVLACGQGAALRPHAELKTGTAVEKMEILGESTSFKVKTGSRIYCWAKIFGAAGTKVAFIFSKGDKSSRQELEVPRTPYRTHAYRTFRAGDEGEWTVKVVGDGGAELGTARLSVAFE